MLRRLASDALRGGPRLIAALAGAAVAALAIATPALAFDHVQIQPRRGPWVQTHDFHDHDHGFHDHDRDRFHGHFGLFFGAPAYVTPPPVYYAPAYPYPYGAYPYAPVPVTGVFLTPNGYCRNYQTAAGIETACQGPDGVWRFIN